MRILSDVEGGPRLEVGAVGQLQLDKLRPKSHQGKVKVLHGGNPGGGDDGDVLLLVVMLLLMVLMMVNHHH